MSSSQCVWYNLKHKYKIEIEIYQLKPTFNTSTHLFRLKIFNERGLIALHLWPALS